MPSNERSPRTVRLLTVAVIAGTFAAGFATGAGLYRWATVDYLRPLPPPPPLLAPWVMEQLDLSAPQKQKAHQILGRHRPKLEAIFRDTFPKVRAEKEQAEREIRAILSPEQRKKLDELQARRPRPPREKMPADFGPPPLHGDLVPEAPPEDEPLELPDRGMAPDAG
jgi:hypothetical protein